MVLANSYILGCNGYWRSLFVALSGIWKAVLSKEHSFQSRHSICKWSLKTLNQRVFFCALGDLTVYILNFNLNNLFPLFYLIQPSLRFLLSHGFLSQIIWHIMDHRQQALFLSTFVLSSVLKSEEGSRKLSSIDSFLGYKVGRQIGTVPPFPP